ncbi:MAG: FIST signal transduction protein [Wenzhouxiangella sp.]
MTKLFFDQAADFATLQALTEQALAANAGSLMLLGCEANDYPIEQLDPWLKSLPIPVFGGVFPRLVIGNRHVERGFVVVAMDETVTVHNIAGLSEADNDLHGQIESTLAGADTDISVLLLLDGLGSRIVELLDAVYDQLGSNTVYFGGGAGSLSFERRPCLFSNQGLLVDHAQITLLAGRYDLGVEHGWQKAAGPFVVTEAQHNVVTAIDFKPAAEVYRAQVETLGGQRFDDHAFFELAKGYPFGLEKPDGSLLVRDPIQQIGTELHCVGEVPANSMVYLLKGQPDALIEAAGRAAKSIRPGSQPAILADCISRVLFLGDEFQAELDALHHGLGGRPVVGMLTLGEVANGGGACLEFYNKTTVLAAPAD